MATDLPANRSSGALSFAPTIAGPGEAGAVHEAKAVLEVGTPTNSAAQGVHQLPILAPLQDCKPASRPILTAEQLQKFSLLLARARAWTELPPVRRGDQKNKGDGPNQPEKPSGLSDDERLWLTRECLLRYLRATRWQVPDAERRLLDTLAWRREFGVGSDPSAASSIPAILTADHISPENKTGKQIIAGYDLQARPCLYLSPGRQNTDPSPRQVQHLVYMVERVLELMPPGQETISLMINFAKSGRRSNTGPGIGIAREVLHILQTHYPERLGRALIINVPWLVWGFFKLITPFIDPVTYEKLKFNQDMSLYVPREHLWTEWKGDMRFEYDHATYWPALEHICRDRRTERRRRWEAGGCQIGELEDYLCGSAPSGVAPPPGPQSPVGAEQEVKREDDVNVEA